MTLEEHLKDVSIVFAVLDRQWTSMIFPNQQKYFKSTMKTKTKIESKMVSKSEKRYQKV